MRFKDLNTHKLLKSYDRKLAVKGNSAMTDNYSIRAGVPETNILGPTLYVLYTEDITTSRRLVKCTFVDDTAILSHSRCLRATIRAIGNLVRLLTWRRHIEAKGSQLNTRSCSTIPYLNLSGPLAPSYGGVLAVAIFMLHAQSKILRTIMS